ncbi:PIN2/TERF1-interacting telomerase inhibitor 1 [Pseudorasbora parva]|uniref:PIN2/TERF1-interacting telomerase inhibitor 1 n=1 Tax=Pseudorasbora parva TaxID=51549 RepID=UPI00351E8D8C
MSMLAEPRRKQKWSVDPRNSAWSNDESKFGQKMLERMGWAKGKGLGKTEQGSTENIKVKVKNNKMGLGTAVNNEDNWIAHQDDFNQLLADLNNCHGQNLTDNPTPTQEQGFSLEEKSKTSKKRVHYMKFTKGKDLSSRSKTDLACIFGKRSKQETRDQSEGSSGPDSQEEREEDSDTVTNSNPEKQLNTVTSTLTMQEYFAQRMAKIKKARGTCDPAVSNNAASPRATSASMEDSQNTSDMEQSKKKKKKKKDRERDRDGTVKKVEEDALTSVTGESFEEPSYSQKKKKNKRKREEREEDVCSAPTVTDGATEDEAPTTRKRKKEKKTSLEVHTDEHKTVETENVDPKVSDKKKRRQQDEEEGATEEVMSKKNKKKQKK